MNSIALIDLAAFLILLFGGISFIYRARKQRSFGRLGINKCALLTVSLALYLSLFFKWNWQSAFFGDAENFISVLIPMFWGILFYGMQQELISADLEKSDALHRHFIEEIPIGLCRISLREGGRFILANQAFAEMFGYDNVEQIQEVRDTTLYMNPEDRERVLEELQRCGKVEQMELPGKKRDGSLIYVSLTLRTAPGANGQPDDVEGTFENITKRKEAEEALKRSEAQHRQAQKIARLAHWQIRNADSSVTCSEEMFRITEIDDVIGTVPHTDLAEKFFNRIHPDDRELVKELLFAASQEGKEVDNVHRLQFADGRIKYVHILGHPEFDEQGNILGVIGTTQDITELKEAELEREKTEQRLLQSQKLEAIGTLAGGIAHDFNNILTSIIGFTELASHEVPADSPTAKKLKTILQAGIRAKDLVSNILTFSRKAEHSFHAVQVSIIVKEAMKLLRASIPANILLSMKIEARQDTVMADPTQLHQVIMNLCTNGYHAIGENGGEIKVELSERELASGDIQKGFNASPGQYVHLMIKDTGHGMPKDVLQRIFDPYFTTKPQGQGVGLGLSMVHGIIKKHKGQISVYSEPGNGTIFHIFLPCMRKDEIAPVSAQRQWVIPRGNEHILIVDDEQMITDLLTELLEGLGYTVTAYNSGKTLLNDFKTMKERPDLIITDMTMPDICGDKLAMHLLDSAPDMQVILLTGFSDHIDASKAREVGISEYLSKPVTEETLANCVRRVLDGRGGKE